MTFRRVTRVFAAVALAATISLPLTHVVAQTLDDEGDALVTDDFVEPADVYYGDVLDEFVPTSPNVAPCPEGTYYLLYYGEPVTDANGNPVCVAQSPNGQAGSVVPGEPGGSGGGSNSEGVDTPGELGEVPY